MSEYYFVFDTNTIVSALLLRESVSRQAFDLANQLGKIILSLDTIAELNDVLGRVKFDRYIQATERFQFLALLVAEAVLIDVDVTIHECRDPKDDKFLELALSGQADCLVTGDKDLLVLNPFRGIPILTPRAFLSNPWVEELA